MARCPGREAAIVARRPPRGCGKVLHSLAILAGFTLLFAVAAAFFLWLSLTTPYKGFPEARTRVEVRKGANSRSILRKLRAAGVLRDDFIPLLYLAALRHGDSLKAGIYEFTAAASAAEVIEKLIDGDVILKSITLREGLDRFAIAALMAAEGFGKAPEWKTLTADPELIRDLDPRAGSLEGYLYPDTYKLTPGTPPRVIVQIMAANFRKQFGGELALLANGLDLHDTVTLASIVETEASLPQERPLVASVYLNRVRANMPLQADPTVIYAMKLAGQWNGNIRRVDLRLGSPYNTYAQRGFPPGPIANPGLASLKAAASPATTNFLYFVSRNDGSHVFSSTLAEHNRNVDRYQRRRPVEQVAK